MERIKENILVKDMFIYILLASIIFYIPAWSTAIAALVTGNSNYLWIATSYILVWAGPFTPTIPAIMAIAVILKQIVKRTSKE